VAYVIFAALTFKNVRKVPQADWAVVFELSYLSDVLRQSIDEFD